MKELAIILLNFNGSLDTIECLKSLEGSKTKYSYDIYILDNGSEQENYDCLKEYLVKRSDFKICDDQEFLLSDAHQNMLIRSKNNFGFAGGNNRVIAHCYESYRYLLLLNNDTVVVDSFLEEMLTLLNSDSEVKFASCRIDNYYDHNVLWNCGGELKPWGLRRYYTCKELEQMGEVITAEFITGCALFIDCQIIRKYGALTDDFFHGEEDFNFCWRMKKQKVIGKCINKTLVYHKVSLSSRDFGVHSGKVVSYYINRVVDMKHFFSPIVWKLWRECLIIVLRVHWKRQSITKADRLKMIKMLRSMSKKDQVSKEDTFRIWDFVYEE